MLLVYLYFVQKTKIAGFAAPNENGRAAGVYLPTCEDSAAKYGSNFQQQDLYPMYGHGPCYAVRLAFLAGKRAAGIWNPIRPFYIFPLAKAGRGAFFSSALYSNIPPESHESVSRKDTGECRSLSELADGGYLPAMCLHNPFRHR